MSKTKKVLILMNARRPNWIEDTSDKTSVGLHAFVNDLNASSDDVTYGFTTVDRLTFSVIDGEVSIFDTYTKMDLAEYSVIQLRNNSLFIDIAMAISAYGAHKGINVMLELDFGTPIYGKLSQMVYYAINGVSVPNTWSATAPSTLLALLDDSNLTYPLIVKANHGIKGSDNFLVPNRDELEALLDEHHETHFVVQEKIPNDGDYRVLFFGQSDALIFKRVAVKGSHLNNTSRGGQGIAIPVEEFNKDAYALAQKVAALTGRLLNGVDVIQDQVTEKWYILEVNANAALSSGSFVDRKAIGFKKMIEEIL